MNWFIHLLLIFCCSLFFTTLASAPAVSGQHSMLPWETKCRFPLPEAGGFTPQERWAWDERLCLGQAANMSTYGNSDDGKGCDPIKSDEWPEHRKLSEVFLQTILVQQPWSTVSWSARVSISCAWFPQAVDLSQQQFSLALAIDNSRFDGLVNFIGMKTQRSLSFTGSDFRKKFDARGLKVGGSLALYNGARLKEIDIDSAQIDGDLAANGSTIDGKFTANSLKVGITIFLHEASFGEVSLFGAEVGGDIHAYSSTFYGKFDAGIAKVAGDVLLDEKSRFQDVALDGAEIGGNLAATKSAFEGEFSAINLKLVGDLFLREEASFKDVSLINAKVAGALEIWGSKFDGHFDLTGADISQDILLASSRSPPPTWTPAARLTLRNAHAGALQATKDAWTVEGSKVLVTTDLSGFSYDWLSGLEAGEGDSMVNLDTAELVRWLQSHRRPDKEHNAYYRPQPYEQLAKVLRAGGEPAKANEILWAKREHQRTAENTPVLTKFGLWWLKSLIGYGYLPFRALWWFGGLVIIGWFAATRSYDLRNRTWFERFWYSFDKTLPLVQLGPGSMAINHANPEGDSSLQWRVITTWFYFQQIAGFITATFLAAGLSGLAR